MRSYHALSVILLVVVAGSLLLTVRATGVSSGSTTTIRLWDGCDPVSFNQVLGPGGCLPGGHAKETFDTFINEVTLDKIAGAWRSSLVIGSLLPVEGLKRVKSRT